MTTSDFNGNFSIRTIRDSCTISFSFVGYMTKIVTLTKDSTINIILESNYNYNTRWLTIGTSYDFVNSVFGFQLSNGFDEEPLIHFEDFQDNLLCKIQGQTDFESDYSYSAEIGLLYPFIPYVGHLSFAYSVINFKTTRLLIKDFHLSARIGYFRNTLMLFNLGYQNFSENKNFGFMLGMEQNIENAYFGFSSGYYFDYFQYSVYFQAVLYKNGIFSLRTAYNRIDDYNLLTLGLHYTFIRNKNR